MKCSASDMIDVFIEQGYRVTFKVTIFNSSPSTNTSIPTSSDNIIEDTSAADLDEALRLKEDKNRRLSSNNFLEPVKRVDETAVDASVATTNPRYRDGHEPRSAKQQEEAMTSRVNKIYGFPATSTPLAGELNKKDLMKNPPLTLLNDDSSIIFLQSLVNHCQANGCYVPSLKEIKTDNPMGTAWKGLTMTHTRRDGMTAALYALLHLLCKDDKIHKRYHQVILDGMGNGYIALYNL